MALYKLTYFDFPGSRGEECRLALHLGGATFEDNRIKGAEWPQHKASMPYGAMPVLDVEGLGRLAHSNAILCFLGRRLGLHPSDEWQAAKHEELMCAAEELRGEVGPTLRISDPEQKQRAREALAEGYLRSWGANVERALGEGPFVGGSKINVADLKLYMIVRWFAGGSVDHVPADIFAAHTKLMRVYEAVKNHPKVVEWYAR